MGAMSIWHWLLVIIVILLLFGGGKITSVMGDLAKGIKSFKRELKDGEEPGATGEVKTDPAKLTPPQTPADSQSSNTESGAR